MQDSAVGRSVISVSVLFGTFDFDGLWELRRRLSSLSEGEFGR
jgi:hypothetical protein